MDPEDIDLAASSLWMIRAGETNRLVQPFLDEGVVGVSFGDLPDGTMVDGPKLQRLLAAAFVAKPEQVATQFLSFVNRVEVGDVVFMPDAATSSFIVGTVSGKYTYDPDIAPELCRHRRSVDWRRSIPYALLPERLDALPKQQVVVTELAEGRLRVLAHEAFLHQVGTDPFVRPEPKKPAKAPKAPKAPRAPRAPRAPKKVAKPPRPMRRCQSCLMQKQLSFFEGDAEHCNDCLY